MAPVSRWQASRQPTHACRAGGTVSKTRPGAPSRSGGPAPTIARAPRSSPAAGGWRQGLSSQRRRVGVGLARGLGSPPVLVSAIQPSHEPVRS